MRAKITHSIILDRIAACGPDGISRPELMEGLQEWEMKRALRLAILAGQPLIFRRYHADGMAVMFFKCDEDRAAFDAKNTVEKKARKTVRDASRKAEKIGRAHV